MPHESDASSSVSDSGDDKVPELDGPLEDRPAPKRLRCKDGHRRPNGRWEARHRPKSPVILDHSNPQVASAYRGIDPRTRLHKYEWLQYFDSKREKDAFIQAKRELFKLAKKQAVAKKMHEFGPMSVVLPPNDHGPFDGPGSGHYQPRRGGDVPPPPYDHPYGDQYHHDSASSSSPILDPRYLAAMHHPHVSSPEKPVPYDMIRPSRYHQQQQPPPYVEGSAQPQYYHGPPPPSMSPMYHHPHHSGRFPPSIIPASSECREPYHHVVPMHPHVDVRSYHFDGVPPRDYHEPPPRPYMETPGTVVDGYVDHSTTSSPSATSMYHWPPAASPKSPVHMKLPALSPTTDPPDTTKAPAPQQPQQQPTYPHQQPHHHQQHHHRPDRDVLSASSSSSSFGDSHPPPKHPGKHPVVGYHPPQAKGTNPPQNKDGMHLAVDTSSLSCDVNKITPDSARMTMMESLQYPAVDRSTINSLPTDDGHDTDDDHNFDHSDGVAEILAGMRDNLRATVAT